jgi:hypothetical protein
MQYIETCEFYFGQIGDASGPSPAILIIVPNPWFKQVSS